MTKQNEAVYLVTSSFVHSHALDKWDSKRIDLVGSVRLVHYSQRHTKSQPLQIAHLHHFTLYHILQLHVLIQQHWPIQLKADHPLCVFNYTHMTLTLTPLPQYWTLICMFWRSTCVLTRSSAAATTACDAWNGHSRSLKVICIVTPTDTAYMTSY